MGAGARASARRAGARPPPVCPPPRPPFSPGLPARNPPPMPPRPCAAAQERAGVPPTHPRTPARAVHCCTRTCWCPGATPPPRCCASWHRSSSCFCSSWCGEGAGWCPDGAACFWRVRVFVCVCARVFFEGARRPLRQQRCSRYLGLAGQAALPRQQRPGAELAPPPTTHADQPCIPCRQQRGHLPGAEHQPGGDAGKDQREEGGRR